ncbi:hypothetical protein ACFWJ5_21880 [Streptomyces qaidamensis]|uniref:hypothetical protein n=1 Tax=Streptomyces qaidamensis TaxID=1783515 RepID=UPI00364B74C8
MPAGVRRHQQAAQVVGLEEGQRRGAAPRGEGAARVRPRDGRGTEGAAVALPYEPVVGLGQGLVQAPGGAPLVDG